MNDDHTTKTGAAGAVVDTENQTTTNAGSPSCAQMMNDNSELHERIMEAARAEGLPTDIIDLPSMLSVQHDEDGDKYVTDCNNVIRYYFGTGSMSGSIVPTDDFIQNAQVVESNERDNTFEQIYNEY